MKDNSEHDTSIEVNKLDEDIAALYRQQTQKKPEPVSSKLKQSDGILCLNVALSALELKQEPTNTNIDTNFVQKL